MKEVAISSKAIPASPRSKNYPTGSTVVRTGGGNTTITLPGGGSNIDVLKTTDAKSMTDSNVLSSLRTLLEIRSRIIASTNTETELTEDNTLSSLHTIAEIDAAIAAALKDVEALYLSKTKADTAAEAITFLKGLFVGDNLAFIDANGDAEVRNIVARIKAKVATLEVTGDATTLNLLVQQLATTYDLDVSHVATMFRTIIKDYVSSETFVPGLMGEGMKIYKALNGDWNLEIDNVVVRKVMTIFELVISKIRAVNGGLVISSANGHIKSVEETTGDPTYYVLGIEGDMQFVADDLVRCQVFTAGHAKYYWVSVASVTADSILVLKSEFTNGATPVPGDDLIQMGNRTDKNRQGLLYLTASEDGKPRFSVMDGIDSTSLVGKSKVILGCLDGMTDTDFPADFQPSGYGLYAMNVFLKGVFLLRNGKNVEDEVNAAKDAAQDAKDKADTVTQLFQEFTVAGGLFESKITEVKEYADAAKNAAIDAAALDAQNKANAAQAAAELVAIAQAALAKTEASAYADGIVTAEEQRAINDAKAKLEEAKLDATTKADAAKNAAIEDAAGKYNTKSEVSSLISQTKDEINLSVTEKISNVQVGGRNLLLGSSDGKGWNGWIGDNTFQASAASTGESCYIYSSYFQLESQQIYTLSFDSKNDEKITNRDLFILSDNYNENGAILSIGFETSTDWKHIVWTFAAGAEFNGVTNIRLRIDHNGSMDGDLSSIWVRNVKLERGNKPTDWTPAPEDIQTQITANASAIEVNKQGIELKASKTEVDGLGNRLTLAEGSLSVQSEQIRAQVTSVDALTGRMNSAELALQPGNIWLGLRDNGFGSIPGYSTRIDTRSLDPNQYYLVTIGMDTTIPYTLTVERPLAYEYGVPLYCSHAYGFSVICKWQSNGSGWGASGVKRIIQTLEYSFVGSCPVGSIGQIIESSEEYIYVRGGSLYNIRVDGASSAVVTLRTSIHTPRPDFPHISRPGVIDSVVQPIPDLDLKPSKDELLSTGIDITNRKIVLTSDKVVFQNNSGNQIAVFENDRIKADLIDASKIVTAELIAGIINATNITATNLTVTGNSKIAGFSVNGDSLVNTNDEASILIKNGAESWAKYVNIGGDTLNLVTIQSSGNDTTGLLVVSPTPTVGRWMERYAIRSYGSHLFAQNENDMWNAPGVLWCGRYNTENGGITSWGNGTASSPSIRRFSTGGYAVTHNLNHTQYFVSVLPIVYNGNWQNWAIIPRYADLGSNAFNLYFRATNDTDVDPKEFMVMIYGRNKWR